MKTYGSFTKVPEISIFLGNLSEFLDISSLFLSIKVD
ncbi:hypothetical protein B6N60_03331 [Richelia sinica FACHB-800]|uniref:Uncharacterized protein n=1 Tax=Richelia sinica FACHB-800 TaxID=1357546 RepID=A0A975T9J9_9NOST|nr:hypothetical protein B6N60_03331 [Richelia sinica FACHB-800]